MTGCVPALHAHVGQCYEAGKAEGEERLAALVAAVEGLLGDLAVIDDVGWVLADDLRAVLADHADVRAVEAVTDWRCPYVTTDPERTRRARDDGWRCGKPAEPPHSHTLYSGDGERWLYTSGPWVLRTNAGERP